VPSEPYLFKTSGDVYISGIEDINKNVSEGVLNFEIPAGTYLVQLNLIDWNQEPGALLEDGSPSPEALPDLIVFIDEYVSETKCRHSVETFRKEDALR